MSQVTSSSKIHSVLMPIHKALFEGISHELLRIMRSSQHVVCMELAKEICSELNIDENTENTSGEVIIFNTSIVWCSHTTFSFFHWVLAYCPNDRSRGMAVPRAD